MLTARRDILHFVQQAGARYWPSGIFPRDQYGDAQVDLGTLGRLWQRVRLPEAHMSLGINGEMLVDSACVNEQGVDWYLAAFAHLSAIAEWQHEAAHGPIHSYAFRLKSAPSHLFDHAWANRIMLLMRAMEPEKDFGPLPKAQFHITHDVDALDKTIPIRIKQGAFELFNALRKASLTHLKNVFAVLLGPARYDHLDTVADMVAAKGMRSVFHLYARTRRSLFLKFMDPGYSIDDARIRAFVAARSAQGFVFGLHPSFADWKDPSALNDARNLFTKTLGMAPVSIRQHWLRFSLRDTWRAQAQTGFTLDYTFGFNDRTGFRAGAALVYRPWDFTKNTAHALYICPTMAMDSHFYAYQSLSPGERQNAMAALVAEVKAVHGEAAILWHPHSLAADYGWKDGFKDMLNLVGDDA